MIKIDFPENRYKHSHAVGLKMYEYAKNVLLWEEDKCIQMFILGNVHDICYYFNDNDECQSKLFFYATEGVFKYNREVKYHPKLTNEYTSQELDLLYFADSTVDGQGNWCTYEERLEDIAQRHGLESECYKITKEIIDYLKKKGFDDSLNN